MKLSRVRIVAAAFGVIAAALPVAQASASEVTIVDPVRGCSYTVGWNVDTANVNQTRAYTSGSCMG